MLNAKFFDSETGSTLQNASSVRHRQIEDQLNESSTNGSVRAIRISRWAGREYLLMAPIRLAEGVQTAAVIDVTDEANLLRVGDWAYLLEHSEGENLVYRYSYGVDTHPARWADLPIRLDHGTPADYAATREAQMDALEDHVDAGGAIR